MMAGWLWENRAIILALAMMLSSMTTCAAEDPLKQNLAVDIAAWTLNPDGGNPVRIFQEPSIQISGHPAMRLVYTDTLPHWGNIKREIDVPAATRAISLRLYKHSSMPQACLYLWLIEKDGDQWHQKLLFDGKILGAVSSGWLEADAPVGAFIFKPTGDGKRDMAHAATLLIGCNYGDIDVSFSDIRFALAGETPQASPATLPPPTPEPGEKGRIVILSENFILRKPDSQGVFNPDEKPTPEELKGSPSASDPVWLSEMARRAGYGATLVSASALSSPGYLSTNNFDVLVIPNAPYYPREAASAIQSFLASGGSLFTTGGYAFDKPCVRAGPAWWTAEQALTVEEVDNRVAPVNLNHRYGIPSDGQGPDPTQIPLFDPMNPLKRAAYAESLVSFIPQVRIDGPFEGWAASALLGNNDPVFPQAYARRIPLLMAYDGIGRPAGALGEIVHNFAGPYKRSSWAAFGVTNVDLFAKTGALAFEFSDILDRVAHKVFLHSLKTDLALYKPGETATITVTCANYEVEPVKVWVLFEIDTRDGIPTAKLDPVEREIAPGFEERIQIQWPIPSASSADFYKISCKMTASSRDDIMETAFCVGNPEAQRKGFPLTFQDNYFGRAGTPRFMLGTNQTGAMFSSAFEDPLVWEKDLDAMRSQGLNIMRVLHFSPYVVSGNGKPMATPTDLKVDKLPKWLERKLDAIVQLTARHQIVLFLTLHDWMSLTLTDEELAAQRHFARLIAERYASCPHVIFDVQNEPSVELNTHAAKQLWNRYLTEKYKTQHALSSTWDRYLAGEKLGEVTLDGGAEEWANGKRVDIDLFRVWLLNRWAEANVKGIKDVSKALVTVGFLQHMSAADHLMGMSWLDFANRHYYGSKVEFPHQLKSLDRRFEGKSLTLGEFGSVNDHDARIQGMKRDETDFDWYLEAAGTTLGLGGAFALNWCWKEMPDNVFPWGINTPNDEVPRETLHAFRAFALVTRDFTPHYVTPQVYLAAPDMNRMGLKADLATMAVYRAIDALIARRVDFGVINEASLGKLPPEAKVLIMPVPYTLSDEAYDLLKQFVHKGGVLYVSGDITFDASRKRTRLSRLKELFGLEFVKELQPPMSAESEADKNLRAAIEVKTAGALKIDSSSMWAFKTGKGTAVFNPVPLELRDVPTDQIGRVLAIAGITPFVSDSLDRNTLVFRAVGKGEGEEAFYINNRSNSLQTVGLAGASLELAAGSKAMIVNKNGKTVSVIADGKVTLGGRLWAEAAVPYAIASLDGKPLTETHQLAVTALGTGELKLHAFEGQQVSLWAGEIKKAEWVTLAVRTPQQTPELLIVPAETALAFSTMLIAPKDELPTAAKTIAGRLAFAP